MDPTKLSKSTRQSLDYDSWNLYVELLRSKIQ